MVKAILLWIALVIVFATIAVELIAADETRQVEMSKDQI